jgi:hypothetical protein
LWQILRMSFSFLTKKFQKIEFSLKNVPFSKTIHKMAKNHQKTLCVCTCVRGTIDLKEIFGMIYNH